MFFIIRILILFEFASNLLVGFRGCFNNRKIFFDFVDLDLYLPRVVSMGIAKRNQFVVLMQRYPVELHCKVPPLSINDHKIPHKTAGFASADTIFYVVSTAAAAAVATVSVLPMRPFPPHSSAFVAVQSQQTYMAGTITSIWRIRTLSPD